MDPTDTALVEKSEHHLLLPGRKWKTRSQLSLDNTIPTGELECTCWLHWVGDGRSAPLNNLLTLLSRGIRVLPASTRQEMEDKLPAQKVRPLPGPAPEGRRELEHYHLLPWGKVQAWKIKSSLSPIEILEVGNIVFGVWLKYGGCFHFFF